MSCEFSLLCMHLKESDGIERSRLAIAALWLMKVFKRGELRSIGVLNCASAVEVAQPCGNENGNAVS